MNKFSMRNLLLATTFLLAPCTLASAQDNVVLNQTFVFGPGSVHSFMIASLPASNGGTYDHLHLLASLNTGDGSNQTAFVDATFGNRNQFTYLWTDRGIPTPIQSKLVAYRDADGSVDIYMILGDQYVSGGYTILEAEDGMTYANPPDQGASTPSGTLVFDSSNPAYAPASYIDYSGNTSLQGNLSLKSGSGSSMTFADGTVQSTAWNGVLSGGDYAESVDVTGDRNGYQPGDVLVVDPVDSAHFLKSSQPYSTLVAGIYSTKPGILGRRQATDPKNSTTEVPMAMVGIVPTKVSAENGPIRRGDLLVTSPIYGYAMKGTDQSRMLGAIIGKALAPLESGTGIIEVLVSLQ